jgi:hypothetical protein
MPKPSQNEKTWHKGASICLFCTNPLWIKETQSPIPNDFDNSSGLYLGTELTISTNLIGWFWFTICHAASNRSYPFENLVSYCYYILIFCNGWIPLDKRRISWITSRLLWGPFHLQGVKTINLENYCKLLHYFPFYLYSFFFKEKRNHSFILWKHVFLETIDSLLFIILDKKSFQSIITNRNQHQA